MLIERKGNAINLKHLINWDNDTESYNRVLSNVIYRLTQPSAVRPIKLFLNYPINSNYLVGYNYLRLLNFKMYSLPINCYCFKDRKGAWLNFKTNYTYAKIIKHIVAILEVLSFCWHWNLSVHTNKLKENTKTIKIKINKKLFVFFQAWIYFLNHIMYHISTQF